MRPLKVFRISIGNEINLCVIDSQGTASITLTQQGENASCMDKHTSLIVYIIAKFSLYAIRSTPRCYKIAVKARILLGCFRCCS